MGVGRLPSHAEIEEQIVAWINDTRSDAISAGVIKHKVFELYRMLSRPLSCDRVRSKSLASNVPT